MEKRMYMFRVNKIDYCYAFAIRTFVPKHETSALLKCNEKINTAVIPRALHISLK